MPKNHSKIDISFYIFLFIFFLICIYECVMFILPYYSFLKAIILLVVTSGLYFGYKNNFNIARSKRSIQHLSHGGERNSVGKYAAYCIKNKETIFYSSFIAVSSIILLGMLLDTGRLLSIAIGLFLVIFLIVKIFGFKIQTQIQKSEISNLNTVRFFILSFAIFFIIMKLICDSFQIPQNERVLIYLGFSGIYLVSGFLLFFKYTFSFSGLFRPYNIFSALLVFSLFGLLAFNNGLGEFMKDKVFPKPLIVEEMDLPGIISNEAIIEDIEYEQVLVSSNYDIEPGLGVGSTGESVSALQKVLGNLQYFTGEVSGVFDEETRIALREALIGECEWPESTSGRFGPQAKDCIDNLSISVIKTTEGENNNGVLAQAEEIISQEVQIGDETSVEKLVSQIYEIPAGMSLGSVGIIVSDLQRALQSLGYYEDNISENYDENTRIALRNALIGECGWPESTSGIFGPQAKECIDNLNISISQ